MGCKSVHTSSAKQFIKDFGNFPPTPLVANNPGADFDVVNISGWGARYYTLTRVFRSLNQNPSCANDPDTAHLTRAFAKIKEETLSSTSSFFALFNSMRLYQQLLSIPIFLIFLPLILIFLIWILIRVVYWVLRMPVIGTETLGFFSPKTQFQLEIVAKPVEIKRAKISYESVLSHEHIHLLQYLRPAGSSNLRMDFGFISRVNALVRENVSQEESAYYLSPCEVEARLHEIVLSFYRVSGRLPTDYDNFIAMINSSEFLSDFSRGVILKSEPDCEFDNLEIFNLREVAAAKDFALILSRFSSFFIAKRFIYEVLPVSYAKLLVLYGDRGSANAFLKTVEKTDLYRELYGELSLG